MNTLQSITPEGSVPHRRPAQHLGISHHRTIGLRTGGSLSRCKHDHFGGL